jgi:hypothetical protein
MRHRVDGPAVIERDPATGTVTHEEWCRDDRLHREGEPAVVTRDPATGVVTYEAWHWHGALHREGGPAVTERNPVTGATLVELWYVANRKHREGGPAVIRRTANGMVISESWWVNGEGAAKPRKDAAALASAHAPSVGPCP